MGLQISRMMRQFHYLFGVYGCGHIGNYFTVGSGCDKELYLRVMVSTGQTFVHGYLCEGYVQVFACHCTEF